MHTHELARFFVFNLAGAVAWTGLWSTLSYHLGKSLNSASSTVDLAVGLAAAVLIVPAIMLVHYSARRLEAAAEAAYPGPLPD